MHLVQIFAPRYDNDGDEFPPEMFQRIQHEMTERFGGVTAFLRAPALGLWDDGRGEVQKDDLAIFEVMIEQLDRAWWRSYRQELETRFDQDEIVVRAIHMETL